MSNIYHKNWQVLLASGVKRSSSQDPALLMHHSMVDFGLFIFLHDMSNGSAVLRVAMGVFTLELFIMQKC